MINCRNKYWSKEKQKEYDKQYYLKNKNKLTWQQKIRNHKKIEELKQKRKEYYQKNKDKIKLQTRNWYIKNRYYITKRQSFRARVNKKEYLEIDKKCELCNEKREYVLHWHHRDFNVLNNNLSNVQILCANCHMEVHHLERQKNYVRQN